MDYPSGMSITNNPRALYVAAGTGIFKYTSTGPPRILGGQADDVEVDPRGNIAAENGSSVVTCYTSTSTSQGFTIGDPSGAFEFIGYGAFDAAGDLYIDGINHAMSTQIGVIYGGCSSGANAILDLSTENVIGFPAGVQIENNGNIAIEDEGQGMGAPSGIYAYNPPNGFGSLGLPVTTTVLQGSSSVSNFAFTPGSRTVFASNGDLYSFPAGQLLRNSGTSGYGAGLLPSEQY